MQASAAVLAGDLWHRIVRGAPWPADARAARRAHGALVLGLPALQLGVVYGARLGGEFGGRYGLPICLIAACTGQHAKRVVLQRQSQVR